MLPPEIAASRRVMEKAGLTCRGEARWKSHDVVWYALDRDTWEAPS
jgi:RimJ/RimL family protein N-acetyltransferase